MKITFEIEITPAELAELLAIAEKVPTDEQLEAMEKEIFEHDGGAPFDEPEPERIITAGMVEEVASMLNIPVKNINEYLDEKSIYTVEQFFNSDQVDEAYKTAASQILK